MASSCVYRFLKCTVPSTVTAVLVLTSIILLVSSISDAAETDTCEYDIDLSSKKVKIICQGSTSMINVYANSAHVQESEFKSEKMYPDNIDGIKTKDINKHYPNLTPGYSNSPTRARKPLESEPRVEPSERFTYHEPGYHSAWESDDLQGDREEMALKYDSSFAATVWNVSEKLYKAKQNLSSCSASIKNISTQLSQGDFTNRPDIENLRRVNNSGTDLTEGIIEALRNQYNYMSSALLSRSYELQKLAVAMTMLVDATADGLNSAVTAHKMVTHELSLMETFFKRLRRRVTRTVSRSDGPPTQVVSNGTAGVCPRQISAIGIGTVQNMQWSTGSYMVQFTNSSDRGSVFIMADTGPTSELREYHTALEVEYDLVSKQLTLPFSCSGTGHVVYRRHFYCHKTDSNLIVKYNLKRMAIVSELALPGAKFGNTQPYTSGANTDVDLAIDELGLWAIYANETGNITITKIDHEKMEITGTWLTTFPKKQAGNAFLVCGVMYATNSHSDIPTFIRYMYNTESSKGQFLDDGAVSFYNSALSGLNDEMPKVAEEMSANSVMLSYDLMNTVLYSWNNGRLESFPVYFKESE